MKIISHRCTCGEKLRWSTKSPSGYVPLAGSVAPLRGHVPAILIEDGRARIVSDAQCGAVGT